MRVFISHSSKDKPAVEALAVSLRQRGIDAWLDKWEIAAGDDIVALINQGLDQADAGIIVFSRHSRESRWVEAEVSYLTYARIQEGKVLIPVMAGEDAWVPPLLRPLARRAIDEPEAVADALLGRRAGPPPLGPPEEGRINEVVISLHRRNPEGLRAEVRIGGEVHGGETLEALPRDLMRAQAKFLRGFRAGLRRDRASAERVAMEAHVVELGRQLGTLCLPGESGKAVSELLDGGRRIGKQVRVCVEAEGSELLGLPFEALRLPDDRVLATHPSVVMFRRPLDLDDTKSDPLAGPLKILVVVGAPDEEYAGPAVLDQERELQNILDAVERARSMENAQVRFLEVGHPDAIAAAIESDAYHILHLSCHGSPGKLILEDEEGQPVDTSAERLIEALQSKSRPLPLVLLNACHGGVQKEETASFAETLLRAGVLCVLAMQTSVSDHYATSLARAFYEHLARREHQLASRALAEARKTLERDRLEAVRRGGALLEQTQPEYATATLFVAGEEAPMADFGLDKAPLSARPVHELSGPVPQLRLDELIGRRKELRECLRTLRGKSGGHSGVVLTGLGGVGKSALAGRVMVRLKESGWHVPAVVGRLDLREIALAIAAALVQSKSESSRERAKLLAKPGLEDLLRGTLIGQAVAEEKLVLVLDDFEQNLEPGGGFLDPEAQAALYRLASSARRGRLLITSRYPLPGLDAHLRRIPLGPLSPAESRKLAIRLDALKELPPEELAKILQRVGGHPRMMELLDALMQGGVGRLPRVTEKLRELLTASGADPEAKFEDLDEGMQQALNLGARDVLLEELLEITRQEGIDEILLQVAVSNLPVAPGGAARMLAGSPDALQAGDEETAGKALSRLEDLSLLFRLANGSALVHRWTAEGLAKLAPDGYGQRCRRAGRYRMWRVEHESRSLEDGFEAVRNFLAGRDFDAAVDTANGCIEALRNFRQSQGIASLASEVLETLPEEHPGFSHLADQEAQAFLALGSTDAALRRYAALLDRHQAVARSEPDRADYQRDLSVSYNKMGDLYRALGQGEQAREAYQKALEIRERLALSEPDRADYQRDLSVSYERMGDLYGALGQGEQAREAYQKALEIAERLARSEPDRADYQRDLSVSYERMGDLYRALGQGEQAREAYQKALEIAERLARSEPDRADYQRDLSVSYERMGDLYGALGQGEQAREAYQKALEIAERLARSEPDRADYQRDLSVSYNKMGDLYGALGQGEQAREAYQKALEIAERLARSEPDRADYQRDLSVSYNKMGDLYRALGQGEQAREAYQKALEIRERLALSEPDRADYQRDLSVSYNKMGDLYRALGQGEQAREAYQKALEIRERLARSEPDRADYQRDLSVSYNKMGDLYRALGQGEQAREAYQKALEIRERLARSEPDRADYQRDLSVSYERMGDLYGALGQGEQAREAYQKALEIAERLARSEPDRADYQRDLSVSYNKMGDLYRALGQGEQAREAYQKALEIRERLARSEPDRADYQRDLSVSYNKMGDLYGALGQGEQAREAYQKALEIAERLALSEPDRADYQRDLSVSYNKMGDLYRALGQGEQAREAYQKALEIAERLARSEPDRADYQRDLSVSYNKMGDLYGALGQGEQAREAYQKALEIAERLALSEPDRADYQRDLVVSLFRQAEIDPALAKAALEQALQIVTALKGSGRLNPTDDWMIEDLKRRITEANSSPAGQAR